MPGLVGIVQKQTKGPLDQTLFQRMVAALHHRPWYRVDTFHTPEIAIARVHLNMINPSPAPYISERGRVKVFLHGEIYNDEAGETNQAEFIARAYERFGRDFATRLNGSFVVALIDETNEVLMIATDRIASKPLFYYQDDAGLYFAPEPKALCLVPSLRKRINVPALASFLACGHYLNGQTLIDGLHLLDNATVLIVSAAGIATHKYWQYAFNEAATDRGQAYYEGALGDLIRQAVRRRLHSEHRYGILLSGGYDSRGILGCYIDEHSRKPATTISWGVKPDTPGSDCAIAKSLASKLGLPHAFLPLRAANMARHVTQFVSLHDGLTDACDNYPESLKIFSDIRTEHGVQVILRGDESFGFSRPACDERTTFEKLGVLPLDRSRHYRQILRNTWLSTFSDSILEMLADLRSQCDTKDINLSQNFLYFNQRIKQYINPLNYAKSLEVEVRTPYLDNDILDFMRELPSPYHFGKRFYRNLTRKMFPHLFSEMATRSNLPNLDTVLRNAAFRELVSQTNLTDSSPLKDYFDRDALRRLHENYFAETNRKGNSRHFIEKANKVLARWPSLHRLGYKMYLPIQDKLQHDFITQGRVLLRILTINLYLQRVL